MFSFGDLGPNRAKQRVMVDILVKLQLLPFLLRSDAKLHFFSFLQKQVPLLLQRVHLLHEHCFEEKQILPRVLFGLIKAMGECGLELTGFLEYSLILVDGPLDHGS